MPCFVFALCPIPIPEISASTWPKIQKFRIAEVLKCVKSKTTDTLKTILSELSLMFAIHFLHYFTQISFLVVVGGGIAITESPSGPDFEF